MEKLESLVEDAGSVAVSSARKPADNHFSERLLRFGEVCRRVGLPPVTLSPHCARAVLPARLDDHGPEREAFPDLVWSLRGALFGLIPSVRTTSGNAVCHQIKFWTKPLVGEPKLQQVKAILETDLRGERRLQVILPEEPDVISRPTVLVVEDHLGVAEVIQMLLEQAGYRVLWSANGLEGLCLAQNLSLAAAVLDGDVPGMDGFEICRRLKADRFTRDLPVIFLSGNPNAPQRGTVAGADKVLLKPKGVTELAASLAQLLKR
ncbi:MAG: hypothetical protein RLY20_3197 [Verrucomicrobiota bacterium]|jgi:CheY-like chemotaxis protein